MKATAESSSEGHGPLLMCVSSLILLSISMHALPVAKSQDRGTRYSLSCLVEGGKLLKKGACLDPWIENVGFTRLSYV